MDAIEGYVVRETEKARLIHVKDTRAKVWVPKSVITNMFRQPKPKDSDMPGDPCTIKVHGWYRVKNAEAFGD